MAIIKGKGNGIVGDNPTPSRQVADIHPRQAVAIIKGTSADRRHGAEEDYLCHHTSSERIFADGGHPCAKGITGDLVAESCHEVIGITEIGIRSRGYGRAFDGHRSQVGAAVECIVLDEGYVGGDGHRGEVGAAGEGKSFYGCYVTEVVQTGNQIAVKIEVMGFGEGVVFKVNPAPSRQVADIHPCQAGAASECIDSYVCHRRRNSERGQVSGMVERIIAYGSHGAGDGQLGDFASIGKQVLAIGNRIGRVIGEFNPAPIHQIVDFDMGQTVAAAECRVSYISQIGGLIRITWKTD